MAPVIRFFVLVRQHKLKCYLSHFQAGLTFFAFRRYREGTSDSLKSGYPDPQQNQSSPYSSFPGSDASDPYQQPPFSNNKSSDIPDYQPPTY